MTAFARRLWLDDVVLLLALAVIVALRPVGALSFPLAAGIGFAMAWGFATLHVPSRIEVTDESVSFSRYGRTHNFPWRGVARLRIRRFLLADRVLVRVEPSGPWRGRYWVTRALGGYEPLVRELAAISTRLD